MSSVAGTYNPGWTRPPPHWESAARSAAETAKQLGRLGIWARRLSAVGIVLEGIFVPSNKANLSDVVPQDDFERATVAEFRRGVEAGEDSWTMRDWAVDEIYRHRAKKREQKRKLSIAAPVNSSVRVTARQRYRQRCEIDRYGRMRNICGKYGMQAHHIVPDWTLRYGARNDTSKRIPHMPSLNDGMAICVIGNAAMQDTEHHEAHLADSVIENYGRSSKPPGTARLSAVIKVSADAMAAARPDCANQIYLKSAEQFESKDQNQLLRAVKNIGARPLDADTIEALKSGASHPWKKGGP